MLKPNKTWLLLIVADLVIAAFINKYFLDTGFGFEHYTYGYPFTVWATGCGTTTIGNSPYPCGYVPVSYTWLILDYVFWTVVAGITLLIIGLIIRSLRK